jgi:hypothetical protein
MREASDEGRRYLLKDHSSERIRFSDELPTSPVAVLNAACQLGLEGVMCLVERRELARLFTAPVLRRAIDLAVQPLGNGVARQPRDARDLALRLVLAAMQSPDLANPPTCPRATSVRSASALGNPLDRSDKTTAEDYAWRRARVRRALT